MQSNAETGIEPYEYQLILEVLRRDATILDRVRVKLSRAAKEAKEAKDEKTKQILDDSRCACCLKPFVVGRGVGCGECGSRVCRKGCSRWDTPDNAWHCLFCHQRRLLQLWLRRNEKWFETFGGLSADHNDASHRFSTAKSEVFLAGADYAGVGPGVGLAAGGEEDAGDSVERVRDFVEKIVEGLVGDVDEIPIDRLYDHIAYDRLVANYKQPLAGALARLAIALQLSIGNKPAADTPTMAHAALRDLVERAVEEARKLPGLGNPDAGRSTEPGDVADQTYEDLLATAILNKVIEKYQTERVDNNSNTLGAKKTSQNQKYITSEIEVGLDEGVEEGSSSLEPLSQDEYGSDCSAPPSKYSINRQEPLSLTIEEHIEEVTTTYTSDEEERDEAAANGLNFNKAHRVPFPEFGMDIIDLSQESSEELQDEVSTPTHVDLVTPVESWEENWLFQKKKMQAQSEPVSMLVPNPSEDLKPLIGDREADDTSDLSDCSAHSDEEIEDELLEAINNVIPKPPGNTEETEASGLLEAKGRGEINTRTADDARTIVHDNLTMNTATHFQINEPSANGMTNGHNEQKPASPSSGTTEIKLGIEDMLVFHLRDKKTSQSEQKTTHQDPSSEFIQAEKSSGNIITLDEKIGGSDVKIPEPASRVKSRASVEITSRSGVQTVVVNSSSTSFTEKSNLDVTGPEVPESVCQLDQPKDQQAKRPSVTPRLNELDKLPQDQLVNQKDDLCSKGCPRTPASSPLKQEVGATEIQTRTDFRSLDEKLVSIETKVGTNLSSLEEKLRSYVPDFEKNQDLNLTEVANGVVEARFAFVESGNENHHTVITEEHRIDLQHEDGAQQESEYTEHYATATQRHLDSLKRPGKGGKILGIHEHDDIPPPIPSTPPPIARLRQCREAAALANLEVDQPEPAERKKVEVDLFLATPPRPGTIAEREHKKWENAAPIENNPYSEENIQKRLWQRQYSRKVSSESSSGVNTEAPKVDGTSIQVVLGAGQPDVKRYGRDYYINEAKKASGERARRSAMLNAGRPNSSLSQNSGSFEGDIEQQDKIQHQETEQTSNSVTEVKTKVTTWQQNNIDSNNSNVVSQGRQRVETTIHLGIAPNKVETNDVTIKRSISEVDNSLKEQSNEELLENVRRNSKNELNAKLNNKEDLEKVAVSQVRRSFGSDHQKSINRIDLKAYGFENAIKTSSSSTTKLTEKRVVNKLDLKSYGYESDLYRNQSIGHIDEKLNNEVHVKPRIVKMKTKSNLTEHHGQRERSKSSQNLVEYEASGDFDVSKSSEIFSEEKNLSDAFDEFGGMISAKSMPNVRKIEHFSQNLTTRHRYNNEEDVIISHFGTKKERLKEEERLRRQMIKASSASHGLWKSETTILTSGRTGSIDLSSDDELDGIIVKAKSTEVLAKKEIFENTSDENTSVVGNINEDDLPMPSVRRLAQAFVSSPEEIPAPAPRVLKTHGATKKERPTTPEVQIIETPRQMHSLTARSLSREFREGLRQIPNKITSPPVSYTTSEQSIIVQTHREVVSSEIDSSGDDVRIIEPGKLKNNIKFWEQLQKQS
ncbi:uncharacterized protein LOC124416427 isoform X4 [Diprion similis]|uniref:uncharacterized protein LOC124416427 isoform X4 n=1 Tax=Diprion similis TaxID=362088 RepID=UPI001EF8EF6C|nr:uncharacterized protein LOC124416427 isoform X4 [Diprion similis]